MQGKDESPRAYIQRFNTEVVQVSTDDDIKKYLLEHRMHPCSDFTKVVGIETPASLDALILKAWAYIQYEDKESANNVRDSQNQENTRVMRHDDRPTFR